MADQVINPFTVQGGVDENGKPVPLDLEKVIRDFGAQRLTKGLVERFERLTGKKAHRFIRRGIVISHRDLEGILDRYEKGQTFYLYTGRGPSSDSMHVGHATPFEFTKYLQEAFDCPLVIQLTDDEKLMHSKKIKSFEEVGGYANKNAKDIIALGFDPKKTFIFINSKYMHTSFYENVCLMAREINPNAIKGAFGFNESTNNIGEFFYCAIQAAPSFATSFPEIFGKDPLKSRSIPCLIPCAIDQDVYFRVCRDNAPKLKYKKPALIHSIFLPALQGSHTKMSASSETSAIYLSDTPNQIKNKINKYAFSGGQDTLEEHKRLGGRTDVDIPYQYLSFFLEDDDELQRLHDGYEKGEIMTGEMKKKCIDVLQAYIGEFQARRKEVTDEVFTHFSTPRAMEYGLNPNPVKEPKKDGKSEKQVEKADPTAPVAKTEKLDQGVASPPKKELVREHAETIESAPKGHKKSMSVRSTKMNGDAAK